MAALVETVLRAAAEKESHFKPTHVEKEIEDYVDEGNLLLVDQNQLDVIKFKKDHETYMRDVARDNTQLLLNKLWQLPMETYEDTVVSQMPKLRTVLPREKPVPKPKAPTKWEQYAKLKSIQNKKRGRMVYDEELKEYRPRWGYKRGDQDVAKTWAIEVPQNADPMEDQFEKRLKAKKEKVAKNELQRLRNIARNRKGKVPGVGLTPTEKPDKDHLQKAFRVAKRSTASMGKFTNKLPKEKPDVKQGKHRKFQPNFSLPNEKQSSLQILKKMRSGASIIDADRAGRQEIVQENNQRAYQKKGGKGGKKFAGKQKGSQMGSQKGNQKGGKTFQGKKKRQK